VNENIEFQVQVGSQTDKLYFSNAANRFPEIAFTFPINCLTVKVGSPFGGLIYINVRIFSFSMPFLI
jgi:hypothetical protein